MEKMYTATLIAASETKSLSQEIVQPLYEHWNGRELIWLGACEAAEFQLVSKPRDFDVTWQALQSQRIDLVLQPSAAREKALLFADMDSTIIQQESLDEIVRAADVGADAAVEDITRRAMNGELDFLEALSARVRLLKGQSAKIIDTVLTHSITVSAGAHLLVNTMVSRGHVTVLISGGFSSIALSVAEKVGFDRFFANTFELEDDLFTGAVVPPIVDREFKRTALREMASQLGIPNTAIIAVGDGANDLDMLTEAGTGVAMHAKPTVAQSCEIKINHADLRALLYIQGYRESQFTEYSSEDR